MSIPLTVWAYDILSSLLDSAKILEILFTHYRRLVRGTIYAYISQNLDLGLRNHETGGRDWQAIETAIDDIESDVWLKVAKEPDSWKPSPSHTATVSTRLFCLAEAYAFYWTQEQLKRRNDVDYQEYEESVSKDLYDNHAQPTKGRQILFSPEEVTKECLACKAILPLDAFHKRTYAPDGRRNTCKECRK